MSVRVCELHKVLCMLHGERFNDNLVNIEMRMNFICAYLVWISYVYELTSYDIYSMDSLFSKLEISFVEAQFRLVPKISYCGQLSVNSF